MIKRVVPSKLRNLWVAHREKKTHKLRSVPYSLLDQRRTGQVVTDDEGERSVIEMIILLKIGVQNAADATEPL